MNEDINKMIDQLVSESLKLLHDRIYTLNVMLLISTIINVISFSFIILVMMQNKRCYKYLEID